MRITQITCDSCREEMAANSNKITFALRQEVANGSDGGTPSVLVFSSAAANSANQYVDKESLDICHNGMAKAIAALYGALGEGSFKDA
jgi:hypothetical protein